MVTDLKTLIIQQIKSVFGPLKVYDEPVKQGLRTPAFLVLVINDTQERQLGDRAKWDYALSVTYFPSDPQSVYSECDAVYEKFKQHFRYIGTEYYVNKLEAEKSDGSLVITFNVKMLVREIFPETLMKTLKFGGVRID